MDSHKPSASTHRDGRLVVYRFGSEAVRNVDRQIEDVVGGVLTSNRGASQREYRFAVSTSGDPVEPRHYIRVSPELRELTSALVSPW